MGKEEGNIAIAKASGLKSDLKHQIREMTHNLFISFLERHRDLLEGVWRYSSEGYFVALKKDDFKNRNIIMGFHDEYDLTDFSDRTPVFIQFAPKEFCEGKREFKKIESI